MDGLSVLKIGKLHNTGLYFFSYLFNKQYRLQPIGRVVAVVGATNGVWLVFPAIGHAISRNWLLRPVAR